MIDSEDYGPVRVIRGKHRGKVGYYDDDEGALCVVYFGVPFEEGGSYGLVRRSSLERVKAHLALDVFARKHPDIVAKLDVVVRR
jgi:hypothetical protein